MHKNARNAANEKAAAQRRSVTDNNNIYGGKNHA